MTRHNNVFGNTEIFLEIVQDVTRESASWTAAEPSCSDWYGCISRQWQPFWCMRMELLKATVRLRMPLVSLLHSLRSTLSLLSYVTFVTFQHGCRKTCCFILPTNHAVMDLPHALRIDQN